MLLHIRRGLQMKRNVWLPLLCGVPLFLALASCRKDQPPAIPIGIGDGFGGADMDIPDVGHEYWPPSKLENAWITTQQGAEDLISWCYQTDSRTARVLLKERQLKLTTPETPPQENLPEPVQGN